MNKKFYNTFYLINIRRFPSYWRIYFTDIYQFFKPMFSCFIHGVPIFVWSSSFFNDTGIVSPHLYKYIRVMVRICNRWCKWHYLNRMAWLYRSLSLFFLTSTSCKHKLRAERRQRPASPAASRPRCTGGSRHRSRPSEEPPPAAASPHGIGPPDSNISRNLNYANLYHL